MSANLVQTSLKSRKKQIFFNAADILDAGGDEKQVFFLLSGLNIIDYLITLWQHFKPTDM